VGGGRVTTVFSGRWVSLQHARIQLNFFPSSNLNHSKRNENSTERGVHSILLHTHTTNYSKWRPLYSPPLGLIREQKRPASSDFQPPGKRFRAIPILYTARRPSSHHQLPLQFKSSLCSHCILIVHTVRPRCRVMRRVMHRYSGLFCVPTR
jgi:hypothetical protein